MNMLDEFRQEINKLMKIEGEVRGVALKTDGEYILREKGEEGLGELEKKLEAMGCPIRYREIKTMDFYPIGLRVISLLAIKEIFGFSNEKIKEMGFDAPKVSLIIKLFAKYFVAVSKAAEKAPLIWKKHYTKGELSAVEVNEKEKRIVLRVEGLDVHPVFCQYLAGYLGSITQMVIAVPVTISETKCSFSGAHYHEYLLTWQ